MNTREFQFSRWENWLEKRVQTLRQAGRVAELRRGGPTTSKPCCSFRVETDHAFGQFDVWGMALDDISFEGAFDDFLNRVTQHPIPGRDTPAPLRSAWFSAKSTL